ncbi:MAG: hypothetical protein ABJZ55_25990 [Fuerstiella sp.]
MKILLLQAAILGLAILAEQSRTDLLPTYCLLLPCCSLCLAMKKTSSSILAVGTALLIQDLLRMESVPLVTIGLLVAGTFVITRPERDPISHRPRSQIYRLTHSWFFLPVLLFISGVLLHFGYQSWQQTLTVDQLKSYLIVAIPVFLISLTALRISKEFGFRYSMT